MSEAIRGGGSTAADAGIPPHPAAGGEASPAACTAKQQPSSQLQTDQTPGKGETSSSADEDEQFKYHQQMLYPTPGLRNYGFTDQFMMYTFKVEPCKRQEKHARGSCPYAHPGDVAQRRHPDAYQALLCPEVRAKKVCPRSNDCQCSHSAFEFWLHPDRYRTSMCEKGERCSRPVCFFAHNEKELRPLPAGLRPALHTPEEAAKRHGNHRPGSVMHSPQDMMGLPAGLPAPGFSRDGVPYMYVTGMGMPGAGRQHPGMTMMQSGYPAAVAGYQGHMAPPAVDVSMQGQWGPMMMTTPYLPQAQLLSPSSQGAAGGAALLGGAPGPAAAAAAAQLSPMAGVTSRASQSSGGNSSVGGMWPQPPQQQQQLGPAMQARPDAAGPASSVQFPVEVLQQFQQLGVGSAAVSPQASSYDPAGGVMPGMVHQYGHQQMMYMTPVPEQSWSHQRQPHGTPYGLVQYGASPVDVQRAQQAAAQSQMAGGPMMGRVVPGSMGPTGLGMQQPGAPGAVFGATDPQAAALGQAWPAGGSMMLAQQDSNPAALVGAGMVMNSRSPSSAGPAPYF